MIVFHFDNLASNNPEPENYDQNVKYGFLEYPITVKFKYQRFNNLDLVYDILQDGAKLDDRDKKFF